MTDFTIATRQKADTLFEGAPSLASGESSTTGVRKVQGYGAVQVFASSQESFEVRVLESCNQDGPFVRTATLTSTVVGTLQVVCERVQQGGVFMQLQVVGAGAQATVDFCGQGLPLG